MFKVHEAAFLGNVPKLERLLEQEDGGNWVHQLNFHKRTPLHECARGDGGSQSLKIAQIILQHITSEQLGAYLKQVDDENSTALYYAVNNSNVNLVEVLLEAEATSGSSARGDGEEQQQRSSRQNQPGTSDGPKSLMNLATVNGSLPVLKLLLKFGYTIEREEYGRLLQTSVVKKNSPSHVEIFKFVIDLMIETEILDEIQQLDDCVKYILHYAAKHCNLGILQAIASHPTLAAEYFPFLRRRNQFTPMHYTLKSWNDEKFATCVHLLLEKCFNSGYAGIVLYEELYNSKVSPLNFAFEEIRQHNAPYYVVKAMVENLPTRSPECWEKVRSNESIINRLYDFTPHVVPILINHSTKLLNFESVQLDFGCVIPVNSSRSPEDNNKDIRDESGPAHLKKPETRYLRKILGKEAAIQRYVLLHPVVKIYLEVKYKSFYTFNLLCCLTQIVFLACYTYLIPSKYSTDVDDVENATTTNGCDFPCAAKPLSQTQSEVNGEDAFDYHTYLHFLLATIIMAVYVIPNGLKEVWQLMSYRFIYFKALINWVQLINLVFVTMICLECFWNVTTLHPIAAISGLLSGILFLRELSKIFTECNIWSSALLKVVTRCIKLAIYFLPLLIGFYLAFKVLIPWRSFNYWLSGIGHMLILMTGEFEYDETFNNKSRSPEWQLFLATISFLSFVMVIVIALSNLLIAVAVEDIKVLRRDSEFKSSASRLENMYNLEMVYLTMSKFTCIKRMLDCPNFMYKVITRMLVTVNECFCSSGSDESKRKHISALALQMSDDGKLIVPKDSFSSEELQEMGFI